MLCRRFFRSLFFVDHVKIIHSISRLKKNEESEEAIFDRPSFTCSDKDVRDIEFVCELTASGLFALPGPVNGFRSTVHGPHLQLGFNLIWLDCNSLSPFSDDPVHFFVAVSSFRVSLLSFRSYLIWRLVPFVLALSPSPSFHDSSDSLVRVFSMNNSVYLPKQSVIFVFTSSLFVVFHLARPIYRTARSSCMFCAAFAKSFSDSFFSAYFEIICFFVTKRRTTFRSE